MVKLAVICAVYNEELLLPQFLNYYSPQADMIFLLDNGSTDRSVEIARGYPNVAVSRYDSDGQFSDVALSEAYNRKRRECAGRYDYVLIADCDEFVVPKNAPTLKEEIALAQPAPETGMGVEFFWTQGWNMWAAPDAMPYDPSRPLLDQRVTGVFSHMYSKPCIIRPGSLLRYEHGRHDFVGLREVKPQDMSPARFHLLHYLGFDVDEFVKRGLERTKRFAQVNVMMRTSGQYLNKTEGDYRATFAAMQAEGLGRVPFKYDGAGSVGLCRRLVIGADHPPRPGWDTLDVGGVGTPTYQFDLMSPGWPIQDDAYDELAVWNVLEYLSDQDASMVLRRFWKILKVGASIRMHVTNAVGLLASPAATKLLSKDALQDLWYGGRSAVQSSTAKRNCYDMATLKKLLFKAGFTDAEDISLSYEDAADVQHAGAGIPINLKVQAFKQAHGGVFGWMPR